MGLEVRVVDYIQDNFKDLDYFADWVKDSGYNDATWLPHDAAHSRLGMKGSIEDQLKTMGIKNVRVLPTGSVDATRRLAKTLIKECYIDADNCKDGLQALRHEKSVWDERKGKYKEIHEIDGAAAFRYLAQALEQPRATQPRQAEDDYVPQAPSWMS